MSESQWPQFQGQPPLAGIPPEPRPDRFPLLSIPQLILASGLSVIFVASLVAMFMVVRSQKAQPREVAASSAVVAPAVISPVPAPAKTEPPKPAPTNDPPALPKVEPKPEPAVAPVAAKAEDKPLPVAPVQQALDPKKLVAMVEPAVVRIETNDGHGSGFVVGDKTVVTNFHVVRGARTAVLTLRSGVNVNVTGFSAVLPGCDLALLVANLPPGTPSLTLVKAPPDKGEDVRTFGAPKGLAWSVTRGIVSGLRTGDEVRNLFGRVKYDEEYGYDRATKWVQTDAGINRGNSGGPLTNMSGEVIGVNTVKTNLDVIDGVPDVVQNLNFAVDAEEVRRLLTQAGQPRPLAALPIQKKPRAPPDDTLGDLRAKLVAEIEVIDRERLTLFRQKADAEAKIVFYDKAVIEAKKEFNQLNIQISSADQRLRNLQANAAQIQQQQKFETNQAIKARLQSKWESLRAQANEVDAEGASLVALRQEVAAKGMALESGKQAQAAELTALFGEADSLRDHFLKLVNPFEKRGRGDLTAALEAMNAWVVRDRRNPFAYSFRAIIYADLGQFTDAVADCERLNALKWGGGLAPFSSGYVRLAQGTAKQAIADFNLAAQASPRNPRVYLFRGTAQRLIPSYDKAIDDFKKAIQFDPRSLSAHIQLAELYAACPVTRCRNPGKAIEHATKAVGLANHWRCHDVLAMAYAEAGRFPDAVTSAKEAIAAAPGSEKAGCQARLRLYEAETAFRIGQ